MTNTICDFCSKNESIKKENMNGIDIYLCGDCLRWRKEIVEYCRDYKGRGAYPIAFLDPLNSSIC